VGLVESAGDADGEEVEGGAVRPRPRLAFGGLTGEPKSIVDLITSTAASSVADKSNRWDRVGAARTSVGPDVGATGRSVIRLPLLMHPLLLHFSPPGRVASGSDAHDRPDERESRP
jgi:hypothetical protein